MKLQCLQTPKPQTASEWAENNVMLPTGKFRYAKRPYFKEITDAMGDINHVCRVVVSCPAQCSKTTAIINFLGYMCTYDPATTLFILDSYTTAKKVLKERVRPFLRDQVRLDALQAGKRTQDNSASCEAISIRSGQTLFIGSAKSASALCSTPAKYIICDEVARFPIDLKNEGDPIYLLLKRQLTFKGMFVMTSTPTTEDGAITQNYKLGTQEVWGAYCDKCHNHMTVKYKDIDFSQDTPIYTCPHCGAEYTENGIIALKHGFYQYNNDPLTDKYGRVCRSFSFTATVAHEVYTWAQIHAEELEARAKGTATYRSFVNTTLGEPFTEDYDNQLDNDTLLKCRHYFTRESLPKWVYDVTVGIDTQDNRFEYVVLGADERAKHICFIERGVILGSPAQAETWRALQATMQELQYINKFGEVFKPRLFCIDSGGHFTHDVYTFCAINNRFKPVKGWADTTRAAESCLIHGVSDVPMKSIGTGAMRTQLTLINTVYAKDLIRQQFINIMLDSKKADWVVSSDETAGFDLTFFNGINSEIRTVTTNGGVRWTCKKGVRNEMLDCTVYALGAFELLRQARANVASIDRFENKKFDDTKQKVDKDEIKSIDTQTINSIISKDRSVRKL